jgi:hypothetical protein
LEIYAQARGRPWRVEEWEIGWAAGLWIRAFNAKKETLDGNAEAVLDRLFNEAPERLRRSGA